MAKAQATRNGQPTPKLDKKIEKMKAMMGMLQYERIRNNRVCGLCA